QLVEVRMADVVSGDAALAVPRLFKRQRTQDVIDPSAHLVDAPASPAPELRRHKIENRYAVEMRPAGQPPVEAGVVDQHNGVGPPMAKEAVGPGKQFKEGRGVGKDAGEPHDGE